MVLLLSVFNVRFDLTIKLAGPLISESTESEISVIHHIDGG